MLAERGDKFKRLLLNLLSLTFSDEERWIMKIILLISNSGRIEA